MKLNHTKGEWEIATINGGADDDEIVTTVNGVTVSIAQVFGACQYGEMEPDGNGGSREYASYSVSVEEAKANARLIVASKDLLEALKGLVNVVGDPPTPEHAVYLNIAEAAIAKATEE